MRGSGRVVKATKRVDLGDRHGGPDRKHISKTRYTQYRGATTSRWKLCVAKRDNHSASRTFPCGDCSARLVADELLMCGGSSTRIRTSKPQPE